jgi:hypothetical protein
MDKLFKILWIIIGIVLLFILPLIGYFFIKEKILRHNFDYVDNSLVVGDEQKLAFKEGKMLQRIIYDQMENIPGTEYHILPVSAEKFENPRDIQAFYTELSETASLAGDINVSSISGHVNIIFLDRDYNVVNTLLQRKAFISAHLTPYIDYDEAQRLDPSIKNVLYLIAFNDTNQDGVLNESDEVDLYISDIDGSNLKQVTKKKEVLDFSFIKNNSEVFITYEKSDSTLAEYKRKHFARYLIEKDTLVEFFDLHRKILELEKKLMIDTVDSQ